MPKKILIVDDDERIAELIRVNLEASGHRVEKFLSSSNALLEFIKTTP